MKFNLPKLDYSMDGLAPILSAETFEFHYGKHHKAYVDKLNAAIEGTPNAEKSLEEIVKNSDGGLFNNAAQSWNHTFYWKCMSPVGKGGQPSAELKAAIDQSFGSMDDFIGKFTEAAAGAFGSAWAWLVIDGGKLKITTTSNADTPIKNGITPILTVDVWEHAYYIDFRNARPKYLEGFTQLINWNYVSECFKTASIPNMTQFMK